MAQLKITDASGRQTQHKLGTQTACLIGRAPDNQIVLDDPRASRKPWAWLLRHVFAIDVTTCPECGGAMRWLAIAVTPERIAEGLAAAPARARGPPRRADLGPSQLAFAFP